MPIRLDTIQYTASPVSKLSVKNPNIRGIIHSIILLVDSCCGVVDGIADIFCIIHMEPPTRTGSRYGRGLSFETKARSIQRKLPSSGTTWWTGGSHEYRCRDRSASLSGVDGNVALNAQNRPKKIGIWMTIGPRHPRGLTPCCLYMRIVSCDARALSLGYLAWISLILGWSWLMAFICRLCFRVRGIMPVRMRTVNTMMLSPKLLKKTQYSITRLLIMGLMMAAFQMSPIRSTTRSCSAFLADVQKRWRLLVREPYPFFVRVAPRVRLKGAH